MRKKISFLLTFVCILVLWGLWGSSVDAQLSTVRNVFIQGVSEPFGASEPFGVHVLWENDPSIPVYIEYYLEDQPDIKRRQEPFGQMLYNDVFIPLQYGKTYIFYIKTLTQSNLAFGPYKFTTNTQTQHNSLPKIIRYSIDSKTIPGMVSIEWDTDIPSVGQVDYYYNNKTGVIKENDLTVKSKHHRLRLSNLLPDTIYRFFIRRTASNYESSGPYLEKSSILPKIKISSVSVSKSDQFGKPAEYQRSFKFQSNLLLDTIRLNINKKSTGEYFVSEAINVSHITPKKSGAGLYIYPLTLSAQYWQKKLSPNTIYRYAITAIKAHKDAPKGALETTYTGEFTTLSSLGTFPTTSNVKISSITDHSVVISYKTLSPAETVINITQLSNGFSWAVAPKGGLALATYHTYTLNNLYPNTIYEVYVGLIKDGPYKFKTLSTSDLPKVSNVKISDVGETSAIVLWVSDVDVEGMVEYYISGKKSSTLKTFTHGLGKETLHTVPLSNLIPDTVYEVLIRNTPNSLNTVGPYSFRTLKSSSKNDLVLVTDETVANITQTSASIKYHIHKTMVNPTIIYGTHPQELTNINNNTVLTATSFSSGEKGYTGNLTLTGLNPSTEYYYQIILDKGTSMEYKSKIHSFVTKDNPVQANAKAFDIKIFNITANSAYISWQTDVPTSSLVIWEEVLNPIVSGMALGNKLTTSHKLLIAKNLKINTKYRVKIRAMTYAYKYLGETTFYTKNNGVKFEILKVGIDKLDAFGSGSEKYRSFNILLSSPANKLTIVIKEKNTGKLFHEQTFGLNSSSIYISPKQWLSPLKPNTIYTYTITAKATNSMLITGQTFDTFTGQFKTGDFADIIPKDKLEITNVFENRVSGQNAVINWTTNIDASATVVYQKAGEKTQKESTKKNIDSKKKHEIILSNLDENTTYYYWVTSKSFNSNSYAKKGPFKFRTSQEFSLDKPFEINDFKFYYPYAGDKHALKMNLTTTRLANKIEAILRVDGGQEQRFKFDLMKGSLEQSQAIYDLQEGTHYFLTVIAYDSFGKDKWSTDFVTQKESSLNIEYFNVQYPFNNDLTKALIKWSTSKEAQSWGYVTTKSPLQKTGDTVKFNIKLYDKYQSYLVSDLIPGQRYYVFVNSVSKDKQQANHKASFVTFKGSNGNSPAVILDSPETNSSLVDSLTQEVKKLRNAVKEQATKIKYLEKFTVELKKISKKIENAINIFITYGVDKNTKGLGSGERAAVVSSFKQAFNRLPRDEGDITELIKIANGRFPSKRNLAKEKQAKLVFQKIYKKIPDMNDPHDSAAIMVMAYGLRQKAKNRNLKSETRGIVTFRNIFGHNPRTTEEWNIMQAITYSGATRNTDSDEDFLPDFREKELGTDPFNPDTDSDGYLDGIEVLNGYDPLVPAKK